MLYISIALKWTWRKRAYINSKIVALGVEIKEGTKYPIIKTPSRLIYSKLKKIKLLDEDCARVKNKKNKKQVVKRLEKTSNNLKRVKKGSIIILKL